ncbi:hypothetical protein C100_06765 [Sphingobium sp. C100]|nr:hypothetical protein C100_06765 [Sphingobium sp. C100]
MACQKILNFRIDRVSNWHPEMKLLPSENGLSRSTSVSHLFGDTRTPAVILNRSNSS